MPTPKSDEKLSAYLQRCIPERQHEHPEEDNDQSVAICASMFKEHKKKGNTE